MEQELKLTGRIIAGKQQARALGYPTANIDYRTSMAPRAGVWICTAIVEQQAHHGVAVIGMWNLEKNLPSLEVHLLNFHETIYEKNMTVQLLQYLRELKTFPTVEDLITQIKKDIMSAENFFATHSS